MTYQLIIRDEAEADLVDAASWYENERPDLGVEFLAETRRMIHNVVANPFLYPAISRHPQIRRALTHRFPYRVFYRIRHGGPRRRLCGRMAYGRRLSRPGWVRLVSALRGLRGCL